MFPNSNTARQFTCNAPKYLYIIGFGFVSYFKEKHDCINKLVYFGSLFDENLNMSTQTK